MISEDFRKQVSGYGLTTAHILYRRPDHRWLLQSYVWQNYDLFPEFPELQRFLAFWMEKLEGPLHSVRVAHCKLIRPAELKAIDGEFRLHCASDRYRHGRAGPGHPRLLFIAMDRGCPAPNLRSLRELRRVSVRRSV